MDYKAIIFDIDGTLVLNNKNARPSNAVIEAINRAQEHIEVVIATSRPYKIAEPIINDLNLKGYVIAHGGARIFSIKENKIIKEHLIGMEEFQKVNKILNNKKIGFILNDDGFDKTNLEILNVYKPLTIYTDPMIPLLAEKLETELKTLTNLAICRITSWVEGKELLTISHPQATKEHAVKEISKLLKIKKETIIGVGDGYNDISLLLACGYKIAMGNAVNSLKNIADYIAPSVHEDGVVDVINKYIINNNLD
jgi:HAD superfamily hydrolase (TIGR01484 family)